RSNCSSYHVPLRAIMVLRSAWASCIATLLLLSSAAANGGAGGFCGRQTHQRSRQLVVGEVQQPLRETIVSQVVGKVNRERRLGEGARGSLDCLASTVTRTFGRGTEVEATNLDESKQHATAAAAEPQSEPGTKTTNTAAGTTATNAGLATRWT
ncbi:unnamed protein product, partial [Ectocarpus sp. 12 AP-2014]